MSRNGITGAVADAIVQSITSFALYGFPESHAASFALLSYASAYLRCHYRAAFLAAMLNNQPMGFYNPMTLIKDAPHGLHSSRWMQRVRTGLHGAQRRVMGASRIT
jgi:error-prone DNA polymerase